MHGALEANIGKMGMGLLRYSPAEIVAVIDRHNQGRNVTELTGIRRAVPVVATVAEALQLGADTLVPGVAPPGGALPPEWRLEIREALLGGMSLVNGLHTPLGQDPDLTSALQPDGYIWDVRREPTGLSNGTGAARTLPCRRVLTVGTDMAIGKMTASLEMDRTARARGLRSKFLATGQIGICITGERTPLLSGVPLDAVRVDFASGCIEAMMLLNGHDHDILHLEGQGSMLNPASTAWLPLIRGGCPTHLILVHRAGLSHLFRFPEIKIPPLTEVCRLYEEVCTAGGTQPPAKVVGIALNCGHLNAEESLAAVERTFQETGIPTADVVRQGADILLDAVLNSE